MSRVVSFSPSRNLSVQRSYYDRYVFPIGNPRIAAKGSPSEGLLLRCNAAGAMKFVWILGYTTCEPNAGWELLPKEQVGRTWIGDTEPQSVLAGVWIDDSPETQMVSKFEYSPPSPLTHNGKPRLEWKPGPKLKVQISGSEAVPMYGILGNVNGLLSLAMHLVTLAQSEIPEGTTISYSPGKDLERSSLPLALEKARFDENVPWERNTNRESTQKP